MNWAVGREYLDRTPFRRGTETLVRKLREDNQRHRRIAEDEEARLLAAAPPLLRSMIVTALDSGMRQGEMLALRFKAVDLARGLITLRGETTKSWRTRLVAIASSCKTAPSPEQRPTGLQVHLAKMPLGERATGAGFQVFLEAGGG